MNNDNCSQAAIMRQYAVIFTVLLGLLLIIIIPSTPGGGGERDLITYWSASRLLVTGENPYDPDALGRIEAELRPEIAVNGPVTPAWNPPWLLLTLAPLTLFPFDLAIRIWIFLNIAFIVIALYLVWQMHDQASDRRGFILILGVGFLLANTITLLRLGQITSLILLSLVLVVWLIQKEMYYLAGGVLLMLTIKPHLTYLVLPIFLIHAILHRRWSIFIGLVTAGLISILIMWLVFPNWISAYIKTLFTLPYSSLSMSTIGSFFETTFGFTYFRYLGLFLIPLSFPLARSVDRIGWLTVLSIALVISLPLAPYGFSFDHVLLILAIVEIILWIRTEKLPPQKAWTVVIGLVLIFAYQLWLLSLPITPYSWWVWSAVAIMVLYILVVKYINAYQSPAQ